MNDERFELVSFEKFAHFIPLSQQCKQKHKNTFLRQLKLLKKKSKHKAV